jgi:SAM-dependent methyltransferase
VSWDPIWEEIFRTRPWGKYPPEELIRFVARHFYQAPDRSDIHILELGCGTGANQWYLAREGFSAHGIDAAPTAIDKARQRLSEEGLAADLILGDVGQLRELIGGQGFDAVIDIGCLQCNQAAGIASIVEQVEACLKPGGYFFAIVVAAGSWGDGLGEMIEPGTYVNIPSGPLAGAGTNHFFAKAEIERLCARFATWRIEHSERSFNNGRECYKVWVVEASKRA